MERNSFRTAAIFEATSLGWFGSAGLSDRNHSQRFTMLSVIFQAEFGLAAKFHTRHGGRVWGASPQVQAMANFFLIHFGCLCIRAGCTFSTVPRKGIPLETWWSHTKSSFSSGGLALFNCSNCCNPFSAVHFRHGADPGT